MLRSSAKADRPECNILETGGGNPSHLPHGASHLLQQRGGRGNLLGLDNPGGQLRDCRRKFTSILNLCGPHVSVLIEHDAYIERGGIRKVPTHANQAM